MFSLLSLAYAIYTATRAELVGRQKSRAEDPRELEADLATKRREHVEVEEGYRVAGTEDASLSAGGPYEVPPAGGRGPEPCDQAYEACAERQVSGCILYSKLFTHTTQIPLAIWRRRHGLSSKRPCSCLLYIRASN